MKKLPNFLFLFLLLSFSCNQTKDIVEASYDRKIEIDDAMLWFNSTYLFKGAARESSNEKYQRDVDWKDVKTIKQDNGLEIVVAPIKYQNKYKPGVIYSNATTPTEKKKHIFDNVSDVEEYVFIFKDKKGANQAQLVQYVPDKTYKKKNGRISTKDFSGLVIASTWDEKPIIGFQFLDGKPSKLFTPNSAPGGKVALCDYVIFEIVSTYCYSCGINCTECDVTITTNVQSFCSGSPGSSSDDPNTGVGYGGGSSSGGGNSGSSGGASEVYEANNNGIKCTSFVFTQTASNWQEAGIRGFYLQIVYLDGTGRSSVRYNIPGQIVVGLPLALANGTTISTGRASEIAAEIVDIAARITFQAFRDFQGVPSSYEVESTFRRKLVSVAQMYGGTAGTNGSGSPLILIKQSEFTLLGTGSCDN
jgi:hypothetical protein